MTDEPIEDDGSAKAESKEPSKPGRLQQLVVEYGVIGLVVFLSISVLTYAGCVVAISAGWETEGAGEEAGVWFAAYIALQLTKPVRIPVVLVLTPIVARVWHRIRGTQAKAEGESESDSDKSTPGDQEPDDQEPDEATRVDRDAEDA